ncbi:SCP-like protein [Ancylostoma duodenale]|uniref:SCP-like protein n=1 Tax=Ancylostoma duodenale TaxID=51022 RepID=A0A0C2D020_9BILA|nr:SCP-like protein [Ancylostoma duodenale]
MAKVYDCEAEKNAFEAAEKYCSGNASSPEKYDENRHVNDAVDHNTDYILEAANSWWDEVVDTDGNLYNSTVNANFANMLWDTREKLGCAIAKCSGKTNVVCHYPKIEKEERKPIYKIGDGPCSDCKEYKVAATCGDNLCSVKA